MIGTTGTYMAPTDMAAHPQVLARVGPGTTNAALVTGVNADASLVNIRVFPDQGESFHLTGIGLVEDLIRGSFVAGAHPEAPPPITRSAQKPLEKRS